MLIVVSSFSLVQSETFGYGRTESIPVNYSTIPTVNNSEYFDGYSISSLYTYYRGLLDSIFAPITEPLSLHLNGDNSPTATIDWDGQDLINVDNLNATTLTVGNANINGNISASNINISGNEDNSFFNNTKLSSIVFKSGCLSDTIAYWQFEDNVLDSYGSHDGGVWTGTASYSDVIKVGQAAVFSGSKKITIPNAADLDFDSAFTIEFWMRDDESPSASLFEKGDYKIEFVSGGKIVASAGVAQVNATGIGIYTNYHIALVWDSSGSELRLYVDGIEKDSAGLGSSANAGSDGLIIGDGFTGLIDELAIYDSALSATKISQHYTKSYFNNHYCKTNSVWELKNDYLYFDGGLNLTGLIYGNGSQLTGISTDYTNVAWLNESDQIFASNQTFNESITGGTGGLTGTRGSLILRGTGIMATGRTSYIEMTAFGDGTPVFITTTASKFFFSNESPKDITPSTPSATVSIDTTTGAMTMADGKFGIGDDGSIEIPIASGSPSYDGVDFSVQAQGGAGRGGPFDGGDAGDNYFLGGIAGTAFGFGTDGESGNVIAQGGLGGTKNGSVILAPDFQGVLIGTTNVSKLNSTNLLHIDGSASASAWLVTSDRLEKSSIQVVDNSSDRFRYKYYLEHDEPIWEIYQENVSYINEKGDLVWEMIDKQKVVGYQMVSSNEYSYGLISDEVDNTFVKKSDGRDVIDLYSLSSQNYIDIGKNQDEIILLKQENEAKDLIIESLISRIEALENPLGVGSL